MTAHVRDARIGDAAGIARVRIETWRAAYSGLVPQEVLDRLDIERETAHRVERWDEYHADAGSHDLVAVADGEVVGWAFAGRAREVLDGVTGELFAIYAHTERWSRGVGHALLTEVERRLVADGHRRAYLWVLAGNQRAAGFYDTHGWHLDGGEKHEEGLHELRRVKLLRD
ncbi:GNAT family N-acetyltransferase [Agrococcus sp. HG114]|uniref:GNAT family N-acetyltransferase n=1 Tax=Agrococcus sp. HG114 TaxID=2969757 RepID=UPI00215A565A|nr:GNAT family N-acetyltransferase [Agrococcus sp. HG114]MCR8670950.1 GNAT family N-acetyltransferase [Agrococcus sp. HG114]